VSQSVSVAVELELVELLEPAFPWGEDPDDDALETGTVPA
jgi:hypothetical protein